MLVVCPAWHRREGAAPARRLLMFAFLPCCESSATIILEHSGRSWSGEIAIGHYANQRCRGRGLRRKRGKLFRGTRDVMGWRSASCDSHSAAARVSFAGSESWSHVQGLNRILNEMAGASM